MHKVISIYDARTNLSKYIKKAQAGQIIYVGAYGQAQAVIAPLPAKQAIAIGVWSRKKRLNSYEYDDLVGSDAALTAEFVKSADKPTLL